VEQFGQVHEVHHPVRPLTATTGQFPAIDVSRYPGRPEAPGSRPRGPATGQQPAYSTGQFPAVGADRSRGPDGAARQRGPATGQQPAYSTGQFPAYSTGQFPAVGPDRGRPDAGGVPARDAGRETADDSHSRDTDQIPAFLPSPEPGEDDPRGSGRRD
jgi:hypothetical protein